MALNNKSNSFTQLPNYLWDMTGLSIYERVILTHIIRKTIGWGKQSDGISLRQFCIDLEISKPTVIKALKALNNKKLIEITKHETKTGAQSFNEYSISKPVIDAVNDVDGVKEIDRGGVKEIDRGGKGDLHTIETITINTNSLKKEQVKKRFSPPTLTEIKNEIELKNYTCPADDFFNYYSSNDWRVGKNKMKSWPHALAMWASRQNNFNNSNNGSNNTTKDIDWDAAW